MSDLIRLRVPKIFFDDHDSRGCVLHSGEAWDYVISRSHSTVTVLLHPLDVLDLLTDAQYYDSFDGPDRWDNSRVCGSARSTVGSLTRQGYGDKQALRTICFPTDPEQAKESNR